MTSAPPARPMTGPHPLPSPTQEDGSENEPARAELVHLVHHRQTVDAALSLAEVHRLFQANSHDFFAITEGTRVVGLCARATVGFMLGSRYGFSLYGNSPVWTARAPRPLIFGSDACAREVLDRTFSRTGSEFFEDIVLVDPDGSLIGLVPVPSLARLQVRLFARQIENIVTKDEELRQQNLELFEVNHLLRQSQGRYKALFENNALGVAVLGPDGNIVAHNRRFEELLRLDEPPAPGDFNLGQWIVPAERGILQRLLNEHEAAAPGAGPRVTELRFDLPGGARLFELHSSWVAETGQICVFLEDITAQRALEQTLARQEKQNMLDTLVAGIAHELNNKLTPVLGFADLLEVIAPEGLSLHTRCISQSAREAAQIIRQLLTLSRPAGNAHDLLDLAQVVGEALEMLRFQLREARCEVQWEHPAAPVYTSGDAAQLKQVFINLVLNSLHAMAECSAPRLSVRLDSAGNLARLLVSDVGTGIRAENLSRIFDPFFTTKGPRGTGLGLSISASLIRQHGGEITVESVYGHGATFCVQLPLSPRPAEPPPSRAPFTARPLPSGPVRRRVLIVDDEEFVRQFMQEAMRTSFGCLIDTAGDGAEAVDRLISGDYDLILSDIRMPRMDGLQLLDWLRQNRPELVGRVVFVTGHAGAAELDEALGRLPCPVIRKPFTLDAIQVACRQFLPPA